MDFENMTKDEIFEFLKDEGWCKLVEEIPGRPDFKVGLYYQLSETGDDEIELYGDNILYLTFEESSKYFL